MIIFFKGSSMLICEMLQTLEMYPLPDVL